MKRLLFVIGQADSDEGWKGDQDLDALREQIREQLAQPVPVVILPRGVYLNAFDLEPEPVPQS